MKRAEAVLAWVLGVAALAVFLAMPILNDDPPILFSLPVSK